MIKRFAPFYNKVDAASRKLHQPLRVLVSTDVLSEGVNLQDGTLLVNYDIHWNPVRLMQRIGRVDRRMNPEIEAALIKEHPALEQSPGTSRSATSFRPLRSRASSSFTTECKGRP